MKIKTLEYKNFRNFRKKGIIKFPTDGTISIIYGMNGAGKTTLHQLMQWIFYGKTNFNASSTEQLFNEPFVNELHYGDKFDVIGRIFFEHPNENGEIEDYVITRDWEYKRGLTRDGSVIESKNLSMQKCVDHDNWEPIKNPEIAIEKILPEGLAPYFFFDGERMISDLKKKGADSAKELKAALYSLFDLDIYELALEHVGSKRKSAATVLGKLHAKQSDNTNSAQIVQLKEQINILKNNVSIANRNIDKINRRIQENDQKLNELSAKIGNNKSRSDLEKERKLSKEVIVKLEDAINNEQIAFGKNLYSVYPMLLMSKLIEQAKKRISLKVENEHLPYGLEKALIDTLLNSEEYCICGHHLGSAEHDKLKELLKAFPPLSYKATYDRFRQDAERLSRELDVNDLEAHIDKIIETQKTIEKFRHKITEIDDALKNSGDVDNLITTRLSVEKQNKECYIKLGSQNDALDKNNKVLNKKMALYDSLMKGQESAKNIRKQISVMEDVKKNLEDQLGKLSESYSKQLRQTVQELVDIIASTEYEVVVSKDFELKVYNRFRNEYKSEGQFAAVTFSYIGGIFRLLRETKVLANKEYPLVLDGPFSKLDAIQRQNVIDHIPSYAPQIIILTFQDLTEYLPKDQQTKIWTIYGNVERNECYVEQGYNPEVFEQ